MKAVVAAFNQEKALVGAFFVITNLRMELFEALQLRLFSVCDCAGVLLEGDGGGSEQPDLGAVLPLPARRPAVRGVPRPLCVTSSGRAEEELVA